MRKHDVRKWLHAVLDLLPVILIPVFMIYSHRHTIDSGSIQVPQNQVVDFNQLVSPSYLRADFTQGDLTFDNEGYYYKVTGTNSNYQYVQLFTTYQLSFFEVGHKYALTEFNVPIFVNLNGQGGIISNDIVITADKTECYFEGRLEPSTYDVIIVPQIFDLTQMFGVGNEPTIEEFKQWYPNEYYEYTLSHKELLKGTLTITYDDTDIMSQVVYQLYNSVDKYFNMGNVFNMTGVYDWFNFNIFNGNAPISIYIVWNIVLYEFVMDLLFLLYGLFMWFIDMVEKLMEKPLKSVK